jgi:penicillin-binding protein 2
MEIGFRFRLYILTTLILVGFGLLLQRLHKVQIIDQQKYLALVPAPRLVSVREPGVRGEIFDRNGVVLARNLRHYDVSFNLDEIEKAYKRQYEEQPVAKTLKKKNGWLRVGSKKDIVGIVKKTVIERLTKYGLAQNFSEKELEVHYATHGGLVPFKYRVDLTYEEFARFAELNMELPGVTINITPSRKYPFQSLASHILGYTKQWEPADVPDNGAQKFDHYIGEEKGVAGVEASMNKYLLGPQGVKTVLMDEKGRTIGLTDYTKPQMGSDVTLTIDARVQYLVENVLRRAGRASAVVMNVHTGEVLAMASVPDFDPNNFIPSISLKKFAAYKNAQLSPLMNRAINAYAPGSTFKLPTAIAGARKGMGSATYSCDGGVTYGNHYVGCWIWNQSKGRHGSVNVMTAIQQSCNPFFNRLANATGVETMSETFDMLSLGRPTGIELPSEKSGMVYGTKLWKQMYPGVSVTPVDLAFSSIGQGVSMATPLQMASVVSSIANGGKYYKPRIVKEVKNPKSGVILADEPKLEVDLMTKGLTEKDLTRIQKGMWMAVNQPGGTAGRVKIPNIQVAAKTGTAQTNDSGKKSNNSWTVSYAPFDKPKYAVCVLVQGGKSGGKVCGPLVHLIYRGLFALDEGMTLPLQPQKEFVGNTDMIDEIKLPEDTLAAIEASQTPINTEITETADNVTVEPVLAEPLRIPTDEPLDVIETPTIKPELDEDGADIPRASPVDESEEE